MAEQATETVSIATSNGPRAVACRHRRGDFAVTAAVEGWLADFMVTHIPTGLAILRTGSLDAATRAIDALLADPPLDWSFTDAQAGGGRANKMRCKARVLAVRKATKGSEDAR